MSTDLWEELSRDRGGKIVLLVLDGLGGLAAPEKGGTELQVAHTPNLDRLALRSSCGLLEIVGPGITPGSGPGHLALFGYEPREHLIGRGVLSALGIDFELREGDVAARGNFATLDREGRVVDRRAGRISTELNRELTQKIRESVTLTFEGEYFFETVSEHRAVLVLRGEGLSGDVQDTDPQVEGHPPREPRPTSKAGEKTAELVASFLEQARRVLAEEKPANALLLRGFASHRRFPTLEERFRLRGVCLADYPMYRGVSRLLGLDVPDAPGGLEASFRRLQSSYEDAHDFYFLHVKDTDKKGENADFDGKVAALEEVDRLIPLVTDVEADVLVVTGDHSTPAVMGAHSWHPVPVLLHSRNARVDDVATFDEIACLRGSLGLRPAVHLMGLALAHAGRLRKYGA